jgi:hypothetical protein
VGFLDTVGLSVGAADTDGALLIEGEKFGAADIPIAVGPFGELGTLFCRCIENCKVLPLPNFSQDRPNAVQAAERAVTHRTPYNVLTKADRS